MANFSIGGKKFEAKTLYTIGTAAPTAGEDFEIRVVADNFTSHIDLRNHLRRMLEELQERKEPRELSV